MHMNVSTWKGKKEVEGEDGNEDEDEGIRSRILPLFTR